MSLNNNFYLGYLLSLIIVYLIFYNLKKYYLLAIILCTMIILSYILTYAGFTIDCPEGYYCGSVSFSTFLFINILPTSFFLNYLVSKISQKNNLEVSKMSIISFVGIIFIYLVYSVVFDLIFANYITFKVFYTFATPLIFMVSLTIILFLPIKILVKNRKK